MTSGASSAFHAPGGGARPAGPGSRGDILSVLEWLTERDRRIVDVLAEHQVFTTAQLAELTFPSLDMAQRRLFRLYRLGVVDRFRWNIPVGSGTWHYTFGPAGAALVAAVRGTDPPRPADLRRRALRLAASPRLAHLLGVNGFFTALGAHVRTHAGTALVTWWSERRCADHYGQVVRPDGYGVWAEGDRQVGFFLEYDTGSEPLSRLAAKLPGYSDLAAAGGPDLRVLIWLQSATRESALHTLLAGDPSSGRVSTGTVELARSLDMTPAGAVWLTPGAQQRCRLIELVRRFRSRGAASE